MTMTYRTITLGSGVASGARAMRAVEGGPRWLLRAEGAALAGLAALIFAKSGLSWGAFAAGILAPDLSSAGYALRPRAGAAVYNFAHSTLAPLALGLLAAWSAYRPGEAAALIWLVHIGLDHALGYGLKYSSGVNETHLGRIGRAA